MADGFHDVPVVDSHTELKSFADHIDPLKPVSAVDSINYFNKVPGETDTKGYFTLTRLGSDIDYTCGIAKDNNPVGWHHGEEGFSEESGTLFDWSEIERVNFLWRLKCGILLYLEVPDEYEAQILKLDPPVSARTLGEFLKLAIEWAEAPGDALASLVFREALKEMDMPPEIYSSIKDRFPDGPVNKFLVGNKRANVRNRNIPIPTAEEEDWIVGKLEVTMNRDD